MNTKAHAADHKTGLRLVVIATLLAVLGFAALAIAPKHAGAAPRPAATSSSYPPGSPSNPPSSSGVSGVSSSRGTSPGSPNSNNNGQLSATGVAVLGLAGLAVVLLLVGGIMIVSARSRRPLIKR